jgi:hypothetical protein
MSDGPTNEITLAEMHRSLLAFGETVRELGALQHDTFAAQTRALDEMTQIADERFDEVRARLDALESFAKGIEAALASFTEGIKAALAEAIETTVSRLRGETPPEADDGSRRKQ